MAFTRSLGTAGAENAQSRAPQIASILGESDRDLPDGRMSDWRPGTKLNHGRYVVDKLLGEGGFGVTYLATDTHTGDPIAIKTLNSECQSHKDFAKFQERFVNEAIALANCRHENIVRVYPKMFQQESVWCMVMEYIAGEDLRQYLKVYGSLSEAEAVTLVVQLGTALAYVHGQGLLHRDVKPGNVLLRNGDLRAPVLIDFGLAREYDLGRSHNMTNVLTEGFAPLEQYDSHGKFGPWTDVYALSATLYVLLTGKYPPDARDRKLKLKKFVPPQKYNPEISDRTHEAILAGMTLDAAERPQSIAQWLEMFDLESLPERSTGKKGRAVPVERPSLEMNSELFSASLTAEAEELTLFSGTVEPASSATSWEAGSSALLATTRELSLAREKELSLAEEKELSLAKESEPKVRAPILRRPGRSLLLPTFEFEVVTVDATGAVIEREELEASYFRENLGSGIVLEMVAVPGGEFLMGSPENEKLREKDEGPQHRVRIAPFFLGKYLVTQAQWQAVAALPKVKRNLDLDPSRFKGSDRPVERISWYDAVEFCARLSLASGRDYRLPSEAEWEYACRAGTTTPFACGDTITSDLVNYCSHCTTYALEPEEKRYRKQTIRVGSLLPNQFGLYDMHGNLWEWVADHYHDSYQGAPTDGRSWRLPENGNRSHYVVRRGGSWDSTPGACRSANRDLELPSLRHSPVSNIGFRVACAPSNRRSAIGYH